MRECHIPNTQTVVIPQHTQRVVDRVPPFDTNHGGNLACFPDAIDIGSAIGHLKSLRVPSCHLVYHIDLFKSRFDGDALFPIIHGYVSAPELCSDVAFSESLDIGVELLLWT